MQGRGRVDEGLLVAVTSSGHALCHVSTLVLQQVVVEVAREFGGEGTSSIDRVGLMMTVCSVLMGLGAVPSGLLGDRIGPRRAYLVYLALLAVAGATAAAAPSRGLFFVGVALVGAAASFHHPVGLAWIATAIPERRSRALGIHGFVGHFGSTLAPALVLVLHASFGWRTAYGAVAVAAALLLVATLLLPRTPAELAHQSLHPASSGRWSLALTPGMVLLLLAMVATGFVHQGFWASWTSFLKDEVGATRAGAGAGRDSLAALANSMGPHLPGWFMGVPKAGESPLAPVAGGMATLVLAFGSAGELFGGAVARRGKGLELYAKMNLVSAVGLLGVALLPGPWLLASGAVFAFFHFGTQPIENDLIAQRVDPRVRGLAYGLKFVVTFGIGSVASLACVGAFPRAGFSAVFIGLAALAAGGAWFVTRLARRATPAASGNQGDHCAA